jgi:hypothetical protein
LAGRSARRWSGLNGRREKWRNCGWRSLQDARFTAFLIVLRCSTAARGNRRKRKAVKMADIRKKNINWRINTNLDGTTPSVDAKLAVLMDIRDELQSVKSLLQDIAAPLRCQNFLRIPKKLDAIRKNTERKKRPTKGATK